MTKVLCTYFECLYNEHTNESDYGICKKEIIVLDEEVDNVFIGCPCAIWKDEENGNKE